MAKIIFLGLIIVGSVFLLSITWEFFLEDIIMPFFGQHAPESLSERREYVTTSTIFAIIALIIPLIVAANADKNRKLAELEREKVIFGLQQALSEIKTLKGLIPICAQCKKVRDDSGYWQQVESYITDHSEAEFSHSICPDCKNKLYGDYLDEDEREEGIN